MKAKKKTVKKNQKKKTSTKKSAKVNSKSQSKKTEKSQGRKTSSASKAKVSKPKSEKNSLSPLISKILNKVIPPFSLKNSQGETVSSKDFMGKKVVLYFYPKDDTPGCTVEGKDFSELHNEFLKSNTLVFGVSKDSVSSHNKFRCKYNFGFELLADVDGKLCELFDVIKEKNMYGRTYMGIERSTFILNEKGQVVAEHRKVKVDGHAAAILESIRNENF